MQIDKLRATVTELEHQLELLGPADAVSRQALQETVAQLRAALDESGVKVSQPTLMARLTESVEQFEVSHPTLTSVLGRLIDMLGQMGI
jgi:methylaspartate ammonia-lyase